MSPPPGSALRRLVPALIVLGLVVGLVVAVPLIRSAFGPPSEPDDGSPPEPAERAIPLPRGGGPFHPRTYRDGGAVVMPVTFPDGSQAEVLLPFKLGPAAIGSFAYVKRAPKECHPEIRVSREDLARSRWIRRTPPIAVFGGADGPRAALWDGKESLKPWDFLAWDFGDWVASVHCQADQEEPSGALSRFVKSLHVRTAKDGFAVLAPRSPVRVVASGFQTGPRIVFELQQGPERDHPLIELTLSRCSPSPIELSPGGTAQGCFEGGVSLYALGPRDLLKELQAGLQVRNVERVGS